MSARNPHALAVMGGICARCHAPITAIGQDPFTGRRLWLAPPMSDPHRSAHCPDGKRHRIRRHEGLAIAGLVTPDSIQDEALELSGVGVALIEHVARHTHAQRSNVA